MSYTTLMIHFIRSKETSTDDFVKITKGENDYTLNVCMYDAVVKKRYNTHISKKNFYKYVNSLLGLAGYDSDPFTEIQISAPFYPCFIFKPADLTSSYIRSQIDTLLELCLDIWYPIEDEEDEDTGPCNDCECSYV